MDYDMVIVGSGPAGYIAAIRAGQCGMKTALIEEKKIGGMCLNWGCIPTKSLIESAKRFDQIFKTPVFGIDGIDLEKVTFNYNQAVKRTNSIIKKLALGIEYLLKKNGVEYSTGRGSIENEHTVSVDKRQVLTTKNILIATGSRPKPVQIPSQTIPITEISELLACSTIPDHIVIVGGGAHTVELAQFFANIRKKVSIAVPDEVLLPGFDPYLCSYLQKKLRRMHIDVFYNAQIHGDTKNTLSINNTRLTCDLLLNGNVRQGVVPESNCPIDKENGFIKVDDHYQSSVKTIYAVGDVNGKSSLAHVASAQGLHVINVLQGIPETLDLSIIPQTLYTVPEIAQIGLTEVQLKQQGIPHKINEFPLSANGKAIIENTQEGFVRLLSETNYGEVVGVQIVAAHATDMIAEAAALMKVEGTIYDVAAVIHAHPTVSEIFMESGFDAMDRPIHK